MAFQYLDANDVGMISLCISLFQDTIPGYYDNMTLTQCRRKMTMKTPHMWIKLGRVDWNDTGQPKKMRVTLAFHRRERFNSANPPHYYLSVGINNPIEPDVALGAKEIADAIKAECKEFDTSVMTPNGHQKHLHLAFQETLDVSLTRLGPIFEYASNSGWLGPANRVPLRHG